MSLVGIVFLIAVALAWYAMHQPVALRNAGSAVMIAFGTVSIQTIRINLVKSLKDG